MKLFQDFGKAILLGLWWFISGYAAITALGSVMFGFVPHPWPLWCGLTNAIIGWVLLLLITHTEHGRKMFYNGLRIENGGVFGTLIAIAIGLPVSFLFAALLFAIGRLLIRLLGLTLPQ